jgi:SAM-dependent methyltransferase
LLIRDACQTIQRSLRVFYRLLEWPQLYRLTQRILAPGADEAIPQIIGHLLTRLPRAHRMLDIGCGPASWLWRLGLHPVGLDLSPAYMAAVHHHGEPAIIASAAMLPFPDSTFDGVWSFGLLHHLPDDMARQAVREMLRVTCRQGYIVIVDAVLPDSAWRQPLAWALRKLDRGGHVRCQQAFDAILPYPPAWGCERVKYSSLGHEGLFCIYRKL